MLTGRITGAPGRGARTAGFLLLVAALAAATWWLAFTAGLERTAARGRAELALAADRLTSQLAQVRELAVLLAAHPDLEALVLAPGDAAGQDAVAGALLLDIADKTGALNIRLTGADGRALAQAKPGLTGLAGPAFRRAMQGALGADHRVGAGGRRIYTFAAPVFGPGGQVRGALSVDVDLWTVEAAWRGNPRSVYFTDDAGVVMVSNRAELLFATLGPVSGPARTRHGYTAAPLAPFPVAARSERAGQEIWRLTAGRFLPARALHLTLPLPVIGLTGEILLDVAPAARLALLQAGAAAALGLALGAMLILLAERRRALARRLDAEAAANAALERRVAERTRALEALNADLRREIAERDRAEAALQQAQADLVQAGKLSALGQMSAGISHELNQPLMAIRSFAENAEQFLDRGRPEVARENLGRIADLARRMGRIIKTLRAFARQETAALSDVDLVGVVEAVLEMSAGRIARTDTTLDWTPPGAPVMVRGGEVRLQQVVMNLVSNALDAMEEGPDRRLSLAIAPGRPVILTLRDSGPGIAEPERIFDPFYSTKEVGRAEGMGLGLSISYRLVESFGGELRGRTHPEGGAEFTVRLLPATLEQAA